MELRVEPYQLPDKPCFNYEELKTALREKTARYETAIYTDDQIKQAKADRAALNKLRKALNDERIRQEREYMRPFLEFKGQIAEIISIVDQPIIAIDRQIKAFEEQQKAEKKQKIFEYWEEKNVPEWMHTYYTEWLNASVSMKSIKAEIDAMIEQFEKDLAVIRALPAYAFEAEEYYKHTHGLAEAVSEAHRLSEMAERKAAYEAEQQRHKDMAMIEAAAARQQAAEVKPEPVAEKPAEPKKQWLSFKALLTVEDAKALKAFFQSRNIEFEKI